MRTPTAATTLTLTVVFVLAAAQPGFAYSQAQISNVSFAYARFLNGVYIVKGTIITVTVTVHNGGSQLATFNVCPSQRIGFDGGGYGDVERFACATITLGTWCSYSSGTVSVPITAYTSASGELLIRVSVYDPAASSSTPLATSPWYYVTHIVPFSQS